MNDILKPYLKDLSDSIRRKINNNNQLIDPQDFKSHIDSLPVLPKEWYGKDVVYIDYTGNVCYAYTKEEFLALREEPYIAKGSAVKISDSVSLWCDGWNVSFYDIKDILRKDKDWGLKDQIRYPIIICEQFASPYYDAHIELSLKYPNLLSPTLTLELTKGYIVSKPNPNLNINTYYAEIFEDDSILVFIRCIGRNNNLDGIKYSVVSDSTFDMDHSHKEVFLSMLDPSTCVFFKKESNVVYYNINNTGWVEGTQFSHGADVYSIIYCEGHTEPEVYTAPISTEEGTYNESPARTCVLCGHTVYYQNNAFFVPDLGIENVHPLYLDRSYVFDLDTNSVIPHLTFSDLIDDVACVRNVWYFNGNNDNTLRLYAKKVGDAYEPVGLYDSVYFNDCFYANGVKYLKPFLGIGSSQDEIIIYGVSVQVTDGEHLSDIQFDIPGSVEPLDVMDAGFYAPWWTYQIQWSEADGYTMNVLRIDNYSYVKSPDTDTTDSFTFFPEYTIRVVSGTGSTSVTVYWGDGTSTSVSGSALEKLKHTYPGVGNYCIKIDVHRGLASLGSQKYYGLYPYPCISDGFGVDYQNGSSNPYASSVVGVVWGKGIYTTAYGAFAGCCNLDYAIISRGGIPLPNHFNIESAVFKGCVNLNKFSLFSAPPQSYDSYYASEAFYDCSKLKFIPSLLAFREGEDGYSVFYTGFDTASIKGCSALQVLPYPFSFWDSGHLSCKSLKLIERVYGDEVCKDFSDLRCVDVFGSLPSRLENNLSLEKLLFYDISDVGAPVVVNCPNIREFYLSGSLSTLVTNVFDRDYDNSICFSAPDNFDIRKYLPQLGKSEWLVYAWREKGGYIGDLGNYTCAWYSSLEDALSRKNPISETEAPSSGEYYCIVDIDFALTTELTGVSADFPSSLFVNREYNFTVSSLSESPLPYNIQVTGADYTWDFSTGNLTISNVYKDVFIKIAILEKSELYEFKPDVEVSTLMFDITKSVDEVNSILTTIPLDTHLVEFQDGSFIQRVLIESIGGLVFEGAQNFIFIFNETTIPLSDAGAEDLEPGWLYPDRLTEAQKIAIGGMFSGTLDSTGKYEISPSVVSSVYGEVGGWNGILMGRNAIVPEPLVTNTEISTLRFAIDRADADILSILESLTYVDSGEGYNMCDFLGLSGAGVPPVVAVQVSLPSGTVYALAKSTSHFYWLSDSIDLGGGPVPKGWQNLVGSDLTLDSPITLTSLPEGSELWNGTLIGTKPVAPTSSLTAFVEGGTINGFKFDTSLNIDDTLLGAAYTTVDATTSICDLLIMNLSDGSSGTALRLVKLTTEMGDVHLVGAHNGTEMVYVYSTKDHTDASTGLSVVQGWQNLVDSSIAMSAGTLPTVSSIALGEVWNGVFVGNL